MSAAKATAGPRCYVVVVCVLAPITVRDAAVVIVDAQRDFLDPTTPAMIGSRQKAFCVPGVQQLLDYARDRRWQVIHVGTRHTGVETLPSYYRRRGLPPYCLEDSYGCEFVSSPLSGETVLYKTWYSAFVGTELQSVLTSGVTDVVWGGVATDCCVQQSVFDADRLGYRSIVPLQAVSASSHEAFVASLVSIAKSVGYVVDVYQMLSAGGVAHPLDDEAVRSAASRWFSDQQSLLGSND